MLSDTYKQPDLHNEWTAIYRDNQLQQALNSEMLNRALSYLQLGPTTLFLDAGCGRGDHSVRLVERGYHGFGIDISALVLQRAKVRLPLYGSGRARVQFVQGALETLPFASNSFDFVHCRGVLMHIPEWKAALQNLCRVLKPNGSILVMENNDRSIETKMLRFARTIMKPRSRMARTEGGLEFWSVSNGQPFLVRVANVGNLTAQMEECGVLPITVLSAGFIDIGLIPFVWARNLAIEFNRLYCAAGLPARLGSGVIVLGRKLGAAKLPCVGANTNSDKGTTPRNDN